MKKSEVIPKVLFTRLLWVPLLGALPFLFVWPALGLRLVASASLLPLTFAVHEFLHVVLLPDDGFSFREGRFFEITVEKEVSPGMVFLSAILPAEVLGSIGLLVVCYDSLIAFPFLLHLIALPEDVAGVGGMRIE
ncbi:hypothetical protein A3L12_02750 [Thermococcus sp. P6]|uniref:hypothetical protein n=1 Tax=Thermococcus sp. P6 TaxID=122420 RepID=UPI000B5A2156|nr:hypothetical protein [Thermococcus sp. P6]ASJ10289.1 hypothetical protein A3L12_02750 [Thermococcus sp. P6]